MRTASKKTMRVATIFTGATACAAVFAPAATATAAATTTGPTIGVPRTTHLFKGVRPYISEKLGCPGGTSNWLHIAYNKSIDACFGFTGTYTGLDGYIFQATSFCGGNNNGWISGYRSNGSYYFTRFGRGTTYAHIPGTNRSHPLSIAAVHISGWLGDGKCGPP